MNSLVAAFNIGIQEILIIGVIGLFPIVLFLWALFDAISFDFSNKNSKIVWILVIFLLPVLGPLLYFIVGKNQHSPEHN